MTELNANDQDSTIEPPRQQENNSGSLYEAPVIPIIETTYSRSPSPMGVLPNEVLIALSKADPSDVLQFMEKYHEGERKSRDKTTENLHILNLKKEEIRSQANVNTKHLSQFAMGIFAALFTGVLMYAYFAGDKALPDSIIKLMTGALAGGGGVTLLNQSKKDKE
ncbi:MAG: hypothetical protein M1G31_26985 [Pseudanabaena sp. Salubria-1]|jgi:hypothetical protein|nr:hypothetical protein [Pseudanabaena sp. Salubria-1]